MYVCRMINNKISSFMGLYCMRDENRHKYKVICTNSAIVRDSIFGKNI